MISFRHDSNHQPKSSEQQAENSDQFSLEVRISDFPKTTTLGNWSADILVQWCQELRLGRTRAKDVLGGSDSSAEAEIRNKSQWMGMEQ